MSKVTIDYKIYIPLAPHFHDYMFFEVGKEYEVSPAVYEQLNRFGAINNPIIEKQTKEVVEAKSELSHKKRVYRKRKNLVIETKILNPVELNK